MQQSNYSFPVRLYFSLWMLRKRTCRVLPRWESLHALVDACAGGFWLGVLRRDALHEIDALYYQNAPRYQNGDYDYQCFDYNRRGLWNWEQKAIRDYFATCRRLLVVGGGGGREVLALSRLGYAIDGFECNSDLVARANELFAIEGQCCGMQHAARDECPKPGVTYDGIVVGWGSYMHIQERHRRIAFLKELHAQMGTGSPLLVSFWYQEGRGRRLKVMAAVANVVRWVLGREFVEFGDGLGPVYEHFFTREQINAELEEASFQLEYYSEEGYGHAVATCVRPVVPA
jgi:hypothetical protein